MAGPLRGTLDWKIEQKTSGIDQILPTMRTDIVLDHTASGPADRHRHQVHVHRDGRMASRGDAAERLRIPDLRLSEGLRSVAAIRLLIPLADCCCIRPSVRRLIRRS